MPGTISVSGVVSGLKTDEIISKIIEYARRPLDRLELQKAEIQARLTTWQSLNTRILALKLKADSIAEASDFQRMRATSSDDDVVTATASTSAIPGTYYVKVTSRAQCHQLASQADAYTSVNDIVGTGTVSIELADGTSFEITLDANNNTLAGLRDAINAADEDVNATIINAGTADDPDYRMLLTSEESGTEHAMTVVDTSGLSGGTAPTFDLNNPVQAASDATVELGEGTGKITVTNSTNTITDLIPGVTLDVRSADASQTIRIDVTRDTSAIKAAIQNFVTQYNDLADAIAAVSDYDAETGESGILLGDFMLQNVQMQIESAVTGAVDALTSEYVALSQIGITLGTSGHLVIDDNELTAALEDNPEDVAKLFATDLQSESAYISMVASTYETQPSGATGWLVEITQAAGRAQVTAGTEMTNPLDADETLTINGIYVELTSGMTIDEVIEEINLHTSETNAVALKTDAAGTGTGNYLTIRRVQYGSSPTVSVLSSRSYLAGDTTGFGNELVTSDDPVGEGELGTGLVGLDVAGTINGEAATGTGQILSLPTTSTNDAKGLSLRVTATAAMGPVAVTFTKGAGASIRDLLIAMTATTGILTTTQNGINDEISDIDDSITTMQTRLADQEERLYQQFSAMEAQLAKLQQQGNYLLAQLSSLTNTTWS